MTRLQRLYRRAANAALRGQCYSTLSAEMPFDEFTELWNYMSAKFKMLGGAVDYRRLWEHRYIFLMLLSHEK